ncbi:MAG: hypothetical protein MPW14_18915 [Candidatus Manganitrophus sp.]|nr:MAG: hypothetical protein MPW14_18915 [Candidatus Manganitrophus sp.]
MQETSAWGEVIILAVPFAALDETLREMGENVNGKPLVDVTNVVTADFQLALGCTTSGAEELQKKVPSAKVIKAFNTVFAEHMYLGKVKDEPITLFAAGDDGEAKAAVLQLGRGDRFRRRRRRPASKRPLAGDPRLLSHPTRLRS